MGWYMGSLGIGEIAARSFLITQRTFDPATEAESSRSTQSQSFDRAPAVDSGSRAVPSHAVEQAVLGCVRRIILYEKEPPEVTPEIIESDGEDLKTGVAAANDKISRSLTDSSEALARSDHSKNEQLVAEGPQDPQASDRGNDIINGVTEAIMFPGNEESPILSSESTILKPMDPDSRHSAVQNSTINDDNHPQGMDTASMKPAKQVTFIDPMVKWLSFLLLRLHTRCVSTSRYLKEWV